MTVALTFMSLGHMANELAALAAANATPELLAELAAQREAASGSDPIHVEHAAMTALIPTLQAKIAALELSAAASPDDDKKTIAMLRKHINDSEKATMAARDKAPTAGPGRGKKGKTDKPPAGVVTESSAAVNKDGTWANDLDPAKNERRPSPPPVEGKTAFEVALAQRQAAAEAEAEVEADPADDGLIPGEELANLNDTMTPADDDDEVI